MAPDCGRRCQVCTGVTCQRSAEPSRGNTLGDIGHAHSRSPRLAEHMAGVHGTGVAGSRHAQVGASGDTGRDISRRDHPKQITAAHRGHQGAVSRLGQESSPSPRRYRTACAFMRARSGIRRPMLSFGRFSGRAPFVQRPRTPAFHAGNTGSNPVRGTSQMSVLFPDGPKIPVKTPVPYCSHGIRRDPTKVSVVSKLT